MNTQSIQQQQQPKELTTAERLILLQGLYEAAKRRDTDKQLEYTNTLCSSNEPFYIQNRIISLAYNSSSNDISDIVGTIRSVLGLPSFNN